MFATQADIIEAGAGVPGVDLVPALDAAIGHFPTEAHRAFVRLLPSVIVARHHLHERDDSGWPGFIALGGTGAGKTAAATFAALAFGLDAGRAVRMLRRETPGLVFARAPPAGARRGIACRALGADGPSVPGAGRAGQGF